MDPRWLKHWATDRGNLIHSQKEPNLDTNLKGFEQIKFQVETEGNNVS